MTSPTERRDWAVIIGRFQPFHTGHGAMLQTALGLAQHVAVVMGSANRAPSHKNPFSAVERETLVRLRLTPSECERIHFVHIDDHFNVEIWAKDVLRSVTALQVQYATQVAAEQPKQARTVLVGHYKDASSYYLRHFPDWGLHEIENVQGLSATAIRQALFQSILEGSVHGFSHPALSAAQNQFIQQWSQSGEAMRLAQEWDFVQTDNARWSSCPYPPIWVTVDVLIEWQNRILLVQRKHPPGAGLWALPGGYVEQHETLFNAALRELQEETGLKLSHQEAKQCLQAVQVFDHPERSIKGRIITHAHHFCLDDLNLAQTPDLLAADDAQAFMWLDLEESSSLDRCLHDDHAHIIMTLLDR